MQAIILAAGIGKRLRPYTDRTPKCLVPVNGIPIIVNSLDRLAEQKVSRVVIVIGYLGNLVVDWIGHEWKGMKIEYVQNDLYATTNNIYSLWLARRFLNKDTVLLECDVYFDSELLKRCLSKKAEDSVVVSRFKPGMNGTVVKLNPDGTIRRMVLARDQREGFDYTSVFKTVNISHFTKEFLKRHFLPNLELYIKTRGTSEYYELILTVLIFHRSQKVKAVLADDVKWVEIDDRNDLAAAEYLFSSAEKRLETVTQIHGGYWRYDFLDFSYLYNPYFPPDGLKKDVFCKAEMLLTNYPSAQREIARMLSTWTCTEPQDLVVCNGASEAIRILCDQAAKKVTIPIPTFNEYERGLAPGQINYYPINELNFEIDIEEFASSVTGSGSNTALIINPNNPTSTHLSGAKIELLLSRLKEIDLIILDESFSDFLPSEEKYSIDYKSHPNLVIVKSLSKSLGVPGLRIGYALSCNQTLLECLRRHIPIWNINSYAEAFIENLFKYRDAFDQSCVQVVKDTKYLHKELSSIEQIKVYPPFANFVFVKLKNGMNSDSVRDHLFVNYNLLLKDCGNKTGLPKKYLRIAARKKEDTGFLIHSMKRMFSGMGAISAPL